MGNVRVCTSIFAGWFETVAFTLVVVKAVVLWADLRNATAVTGVVTVVKVLVGTAVLVVT
jgi:hypothetical protein